MTCKCGHEKEDHEDSKGKCNYLFKAHASCCSDDYCHELAGGCEKYIEAKQ